MTPDERGRISARAGLAAGMLLGVLAAVLGIQWTGVAIALAWFALVAVDIWRIGRRS